MADTTPAPLPPLSQRHIRIKTISVTYGRKIQTAPYESAESRVTLWADVDEDSDINEIDALVALRDVTRNNVLKELAKWKGAEIQAKLDEFYLGLPVELQEAVDAVIDVEVTPPKE